MRLAVSDPALGDEQLGIENCAAGRTTNRVVRQHHKLEVEQVAGSHTSHCGAHAAVEVAISPRLGPVRLGPDDDWTLRRAR